MFVLLRIAKNSDSRCCTFLRDGVAYLAIIQKLCGSFKGDAFDKRVLPFFRERNDAYLGVLITRLRGMPWNVSAVERRQ